MDGPYILPTRDTFVQWANDVKNAGGTVTVIPRGTNAGAYAGRFPSQAGLPPSSYRYVIAPLAVLAWQFGQMSAEQYAQFVYEAQMAVREIGSDTLDNLGEAIAWVGEETGEAIGNALGGWWWLLAAGGVGLALYANRGKIQRAMEG